MNKQKTIQFEGGITPETFKEWLKENHLKGCYRCQSEGKARLIDSYLFAYWLFKEFYEERGKEESNRKNKCLHFVGIYTLTKKKVWCEICKEEAILFDKNDSEKGWKWK